MAKESNYNDLKALKGPDQVRLRPAVIFKSERVLPRAVAALDLHILGRELRRAQAQTIQTSPTSALSPR